MNELNKPPIGLMPHYIWVEHRIEDILQAMKRYNEAGMKIPQEWFNELKSLWIAEKAGSMLST